MSLASVDNFQYKKAIASNIIITYFLSHDLNSAAGWQTNKTLANKMISTPTNRTAAKRNKAPHRPYDEIMMIVNDVNLDRHRAVKHDHDRWGSHLGNQRSGENKLAFTALSS